MPGQIRIRPDGAVELAIGAIRLCWSATCALCDHELKLELGAHPPRLVCTCGVALELRDVTAPPPKPPG